MLREKDLNELKAAKIISYVVNLDARNVMASLSSTPTLVLTVSGCKTIFVVKLADTCLSY